MLPPNQAKETRTRTVLAAMCLLIIAAYALMIDLKGINTDEGLRLGIINGGAAFTINEPFSSHATWAQVLERNSYCAYQPLYFLLQNTLMRIAQTHDVIFFRLVNVFFLWVSLQGLLTLSKAWSLVPRLFLLGLFGFNAYLIMHVLQVREYIASVSFYIWSTWLVLHLDQRPLGRLWRDASWFAAYGVLLTLGFYLQSWVVFPAIGQGVFLLARRRPDLGRFLVRLAFGYALVLTATVPYLLTHKQKVDVGRWGSEHTTFWPQLSDGFHLVLAGHKAGASGFTDFLFWFWLFFIAGTALLLLNRKYRADAPVAAAQDIFRRQGWLMLLCTLVPLVFQVGYFLKLDNLSLWPRYFVIHYFFLTWLVALGFNHLWILRTAAGVPAGMRRGLSVATSGVLLLLLSSAVFQVRSYYRDPFLDTGLSRASNWHNTTAEVARITRPADAIVIHDFIARSAFTFTRAPANRVLLLEELPASALESVDRLIYLESGESPEEKNEIEARMAAVGFRSHQVIPLHAGEGQGFLGDWRVVAFSRP